MKRDVLSLMNYEVLNKRCPDSSSAACNNNSHAGWRTKPLIAWSHL